MKGKFILGMALAAVSVLASAQTPAADSGQPVAAAVQQQFAKGEFAGFKFSIPAGAEITENGGSYLLKYPDGSFGVSMTRTDARASDQRRAESVVRGLARSMKLSAGSVKPVMINGLKGAMATGEVEGSQVSVGVLVYGGKELQLVVMNSHARGEWARELLKTLTR